MTLSDWLNIALFILGAMFAFVGTLLTRQVNHIMKDMEQLYMLHHRDEAELNELRIKIAENYPVKQDIRIMMDDLKSYLAERFKLLEQIARNSKL